VEEEVGEEEAAAVEGKSPECGLELSSNSKCGAPSKSSRESFGGRDVVQTAQIFFSDRATSSCN
jgi:hypothetical protein